MSLPSFHPVGKPFPPGEDTVSISPESPTQLRENMPPLIFRAVHLEPKVGQPVSRAKNHKLGEVQGPGNGSPVEVILYVSAPPC